MRLSQAREASDQAVSRGLEAEDDSPSKHLQLRPNRGGCPGVKILSCRLPPFALHGRTNSGGEGRDMLQPQRRDSAPARHKV